MKPTKKKASKPEDEKPKPGDQYGYPASEDIYSNEEELEDVDPETGKTKSPNAQADEMNEKDRIDDYSGSDLDIPGSELDDKEESAGREDEENNDYSLGGDDHNDLKEDQGD